MALFGALLGIACGGAAKTVPPPSPPPPGTPAVKVKIVNKPGVLISVDQVLVPDTVTVVEFFADWCGACKVVEKKLLSEIEKEPRIVVRKIDIEDDTTPVARHYGVGALPHIRIFDRTGKLVYVLVGNNTTRAGKLAFEVLARQ